jgi:AraC family transcriptional regulator
VHVIPTQRRRAQLWLNGKNQVVPVNPSQLSGQRFPDVLSQTPEVSAAWGAFSLYMAEPPSHATMACSDHILGLVRSGTCRLRCETNGHAIEGWSGAGTINLIPANTLSTWDGRGHRGATLAAVLFIPEAYIARVISQDWSVEPGRIEILQRFLARDAVIESLMSRLVLEAHRGSPSGELYAESACEFLAHHVLRTHSSLAIAPNRTAGGLTPRQFKRIVEYLHENLGTTISLRNLAQLTGLSARHFERAFRQTAGTPPHAHLIAIRVAAAQRLLTSAPHLTVTQIAKQTGFSSPSHLATAFRRQLGVSPAEFRRLRPS